VKKEIEMADELKAGPVITMADAKKMRKWILVSRDGAYLGGGLASSIADAIDTAEQRLDSMKRQLGTVRIWSQPGGYVETAFRLNRKTNQRKKEL
jgi:hypothetical protein